MSLEGERREAADRRTIDLVGEFDAQVWVAAWLQTIEEHPEIPTDGGMMLGWFANAIMAGYDQGRREEQKRDIGEKVREIVYQAAGAATRPLLEDHPNYVFPSERVSEAVGYVCSEFGIPPYPHEERAAESESEMLADPDPDAIWLGDPD